VVCTVVSKRSRNRLGRRHAVVEAAVFPAAMQRAICLLWWWVVCWPSSRVPTWHQTCSPTLLPDLIVDNLNDDTKFDTTFTMLWDEVVGLAAENPA
jgi:hypothetical protein